MSKSQWIRTQYEASTEKNIPLFTSALNNPSLVPNPVPQGNIPKPIQIVEIGALLSPNDRRILKNEGTYRSLLINIDKGDLRSAQADLQDLTTTPNLSQEAITILTNTLAESTQTIPDPNWQAQILASPAELAGYAPVLVSEVEEALNE